MRVPLLASTVLLAGAVLSAQTQTPPPQQQQQGQQQQQTQGRGGRAGQGQAGQGRGGQQGPARDNPNNQAAQPAGTGVISGAVVSSDGGRPVRRARVTLAGGDLGTAKTATSDDQGRFSFTALPAGRFTLAASKAGYVNIQYGQKKPGRAGTPIQLADGQHLEDVKLPLPKGGVITGTVLDENNEASPGTQVTAWRAEMRTGEKRYQQVGADQTDDRGIYRIYGLLPGDYVIRATPRNAVGDIRQAVQDVVSQALAGNQGRGAGPGAGGGRGGAQIGQGLQQLLGGRGGAGGGGAAAMIGGMLADMSGNTEDAGVGYAPVYFPGTTTSTSATAISLDVSQERQGVDFQLQLVQTAKVSGTVTSPDGDTSGVLLTLVNEAEQAMGGGLNTARVQQDGTFSFTNVAPGQYVLQARQGGRGGGRRGQAGAATPGGAPAPPPEVLWGETAVFVDGRPVTGVSISLQPGMKVAGHLVFEGGQPPADLTRVRVALAPAGQAQGLDLAQNAPAQLDASGNFTITGVAPGRYTVRVQAGQIQGMTLKSAVTAGRDILDFPLEVKPNDDVADLTLTMSNQSQELSGTLTDMQNLPATGYTVIVFSTDTRFWTPQSRRIVSSRPGTDGRFIVRNLPAGDYFVAAVIDVEPGEWFDPKFLEQLRAASAHVTLAPGDKKVQDLRLSGGGA
ncbi:MAG: hypothetical protein EPO35_11040 [Acidobacteria bacterium]|nr:MAG: hypothetical protein EPO35_11040 [Acidobacteriota bacterium]